jgi:hypothetical protein
MNKETVDCVYAILGAMAMSTIAIILMIEICKW